MTFQPKLTAWPPTPPSRTGVQEDRCAADPTAPLKDWIYKTPAIGFVLSGWFDYLAEGRAALAAPGAIVLGNAGEHFNVRHHDDTGNTRLVVLLKQTMLDDIANDAGLDAPRFSTTTLAPGPDATRMYVWMRGIALGGDMAEDCEIALAQAALAAPTAQRSETVSAPLHKRALDAARYIEAHYAEPCGLATLADVANTSRYQLARAFSAMMGQSPIQYLINTRVRAAADVLRTTSTPITEVAFDVGFNDISHFYSCFKSALGVTPRQWRLTH